MESYFIFVLIAVLTILSPGPAVVLTLTNTVTYGARGALSGILGVAFGTFIVAGLSASSLGLLLVTSSLAFAVVKMIGAAYLIYLGVKLLLSPPFRIKVGVQSQRSQKTQFFEGVLLQMTNPKAVIFFMSVFPQFMNFNHDVLLVMTYSLLVVAIHVLYSHVAKFARGWFSSDKGERLVNRLSGSTFILFGFSLAGTHRLDIKD